jgi:hypothetical protein
MEPTRTRKKRVVMMVKTPIAIFNGHPSNANPRMISAGLL